MRRRSAGLAVDTLLVTSGRFGQYIITLVAIPLLARTLGLQELGILALGTSAYFYGSIFGDLGLTQALASASAGRESVISRSFFVALRLALFGISLFAFLLAYRFGPRNASVIGLGFAVGACTSLSEDWLLVAGGKYGRLALAQFTGRIAYLVLLVLFLTWRPRAESALLSLGAGGIITVALTHFFVSTGSGRVTGAEHAQHQDGLRSWRQDRIVVRRLILDISGQRVMNLTYNQGLALFLGPFMPAAALGLFSASDRCVRACQALLDGFGVALVSRLAMHRSDDDRFIPMATHALKAAAMLGAVVTTALCLGSHVIMPILFGRAYDGAADVLMLEALLLVPVAVTTVATEAILYVTGDTRGPFWATAVGIVAATSCVPLLIATRSPFALAFGAVVSEIAVAAFLLVRHQRSRAKRTGPKPVRGT